MSQLKLAEGVRFLIRWCLKLSAVTLYVVEDAICSNVLLSVCRTSWGRAFHLLSSAFAPTMLPDLFSYSATMTSLPWHRSVELLCHLPLWGMRPDVVCFSSALSGDEALPWQQAGRVLWLMSSQRVVANKVCGNSAMKALGRQWVLALEMFRVWHRRPLKLSSLISELHGEWARCLQLLVEAREYKDVFSMGAAMMELQTQQQWHLALGLVQQAVLHNLQPDSYVQSLSMTAPIAHGMWETREPKALHVVGQSSH